MMVKFNYEGKDNINQTITLMPRLNYSNELLDELIARLKKERKDIKKLNRSLLIEFNATDKDDSNALELERTIVFSLETLECVKNRLKSISDISSIPEKIPSIIPMLRSVSAKLFDIMPGCSQKLCELSIYLGSVVLDSATLTSAKFDFSQSNHESSSMLDEVKLIVDSKINKQYPNLDFFKH